MVCHCCCGCCIAVIALIALLAFLFKRLFLEKKTIHDCDKKVVLITGCDSGFGRGFALKCLSRGMTVIATCLTPKAIETLKFESRWMPGKLFQIVMDVTSEESVNAAKQKVIEVLENEKKELHGLVNNAGIMGNCFEDDLLTVDDYKSVMDVNVFGTIRVTHAFKALIKKSRGRIVITSSVLGRIAMPSKGPYATSEFALEAYGDTIRQELKDFDVKVAIVEMAVFRTPMIDAATRNLAVDAVWQRATDEAKAQFGDEYVQKRKDMIKKRAYRAHINAEWVTDAYYEALTAVYPRNRYAVGCDATCLYIPMSFLPSCILDALISIVSSEKVASHLTPAL